MLIFPFIDMSASQSTSVRSTPAAKGGAMRRMARRLVEQYALPINTTQEVKEWVEEAEAVMVRVAVM